MMLPNRFNIGLPSFFSKNEIASITIDSEFPYILELMENVRDECDSLIDEMEEDAKENLGIDLETNPKLLADKEALESMSAALSHLIDTFDLFESIMENDVYVWTPPRNEQGNVLWDFEIERPVMEKFDLLKHTLQHPKEQREDKKDTWPYSPLIYLEDSYRELPKMASVQELVDMNDGQIEDLDKFYLQDAIEEIKELKEKNPTIYSSSKSDIQQIIDFFDKKRIKEACRSNNNISMN